MRKRAVKFGPETWAMVREAYLAGECAPSISNRLGPSVCAIRGRVHREGWTKKAHGEAMDRAWYGAGSRPPSPPPGNAELGAAIPRAIPHPGASSEINLDPGSLDPATILREAALAAQGALARGRGAEAMATVKAADVLVSLVRRIEGSKPRGPLGCDAEHTELVQAAFSMALEMAGEIGRELLADPPVGPYIYSRFIFGWRARYLSPEVAAHDLVRARHCGWANQVFDEDGKVRGVQTLAEAEAYP